MKANKHKSALDIFLDALKTKILLKDRNCPAFSFIATMAITEEKYPLFKTGRIEIWKSSSTDADIIVTVNKTKRIETIEELEDFKDEILRDSYYKLLEYFENYETV